MSSFLDGISGFALGEALLFRCLIAPCGTNILHIGGYSNKNQQLVRRKPKMYTVLIPFHSLLCELQVWKWCTVPFPVVPLPVFSVSRGMRMEAPRLATPYLKSVMAQVSCLPGRCEAFCSRLWDWKRSVDVDEVVLHTLISTYNIIYIVTICNDILRLG